MSVKSILLVDDERISPEILSTELEDSGYETTLAFSGEDALKLIKHRRFDLVVTDLAMSGVNGMQVLKEVKSFDPGIGVFILTGYGDMSSAIDALRFGADDYLLKPCDTEEFLLRTKRFFERQEAFRRLRVYEDILPICCVCGDIRDDEGVGVGKGQWMNLSRFINEKTSAKVTHTYCPKCFEREMDSMD
ncbi:MAG: response regulator [Desulfobulbaceae bacterium]|nr:response regulator [Desulfobulbaceae bacterium]